MSGLLTAASDTELADLSVWLEDHPADMDETMRWAAQSWLDSMIENTTAYPAFIVVPSHYCEALDEVIEDWCEILTAHGETFETTLVLDDAG